MLKATSYLKCIKIYALELDKKISYTLQDFVNILTSVSVNFLTVFTK